MSPSYAQPIPFFSLGPVPRPARAELRPLPHGTRRHTARPRDLWSTGNISIDQLINHSANQIVSYNATCFAQKK